MSQVDTELVKVYYYLLDFVPELVINGSDKYQIIKDYNIEYQSELHSIKSIDLKYPMSYKNKMKKILNLQDDLIKYKIKFSDWGKFLGVSQTTRIEIKSDKFFYHEYAGDDAQSVSDWTKIVVYLFKYHDVNINSRFIIHEQVENDENNEDEDMEEKQMYVSDPVLPIRKLNFSFYSNFNTLNYLIISILIFFSIYNKEYDEFIEFLKLNYKLLISIFGIIIIFNHIYQNSKYINYYSFD